MDQQKTKSQTRNSLEIAVFPDLFNCLKFKIRNAQHDICKTLEMKVLESGVPRTGGQQGSIYFQCFIHVHTEEINSFLSCDIHELARTTGYQDIL